MKPLLSILALGILAACATPLPEKRCDLPKPELLLLEDGDCLITGTTYQNDSTGGDPNPVDPKPPTDPNPVDPKPPTDPKPVDPKPPTDPKPDHPKEPKPDPDTGNPCGGNCGNGNGNGGGNGTGNEGGGKGPGKDRDDDHGGKGKDRD